MKRIVIEEDPHVSMEKRVFSVFLKMNLPQKRDDHKVSKFLNSDIL